VIYLLPYSVALARKRTIPTELPPLVGEVSAYFCSYISISSLQTYRTDKELSNKLRKHYFGCKPHGRRVLRWSSTCRRIRMFSILKHIAVSYGHNRTNNNRYSLTFVFGDASEWRRRQWRQSPHSLPQLWNKPLLKASAGHVGMQSPSLSGKMKWPEPRTVELYAWPIHETIEAWNCRTTKALHYHEMNWWTTLGTKFSSIIL
jgi:hypothetical protein